MAKTRHSLGQVKRKSRASFCYLDGEGVVWERQRSEPKGAEKKIGKVTRSKGSLAWVDGDGFVFEIPRKK